MLFNQNFICCAMEWRCGLNVTFQRALELYEFVTQYKNITDSHSVDYFTESHWENLIPDRWKMDLLSLSDSNQFLYPDSLPSGKGTLNYIFY